MGQNDQPKQVFVRTPPGGTLVIINNADRPPLLLRGVVGCGSVVRKKLKSAFQLMNELNGGSITTMNCGRGTNSQVNNSICMSELKDQNRELELG